MTDAPTFHGSHEPPHAMPYSDNAIRDGGENGDDGFDWSTIAGSAQPDDGSQSRSDAGSGGYEEFLRSDEPYDEPDAGLLTSKPRSPKARQYERKAKGLFSTAFKMTCAQPATVTDSAAILMHGPDVAAKIGDLAAENAHVARAVDLITDGTENTAAALVLAAFPFVLQLIRNHEEALQPKMRGLRVPFTKGKRVFRFKFGIPVGTRVRNMTNEPRQLYGYVFSQDAITNALQKHGITVAPLR